MKDTAENILDYYWNYKLPVDVNLIIQQMGIHVQYVDAIDSSNKNAIGKIEILNHRQITFIIRNQSNDSLWQKRFTLAHQIGHVALNHHSNHGNNLIETINCFNLNNPNWIEKEANIFAMRLLMPKNAIETAIMDLNLSTVSQLATLFNVSQLSMRTRLKELKWI